MVLIKINIGNRNTKDSTPTRLSQIFTKTIDFEVTNYFILKIF